MVEQYVLDMNERIAKLEKESTVHARNILNVYNTLVKHVHVGDQVAIVNTQFLGAESEEVKQ